jgi:hypothetical protein
MEGALAPEREGPWNCGLWTAGAELRDGPLPHDGAPRPHVEDEGGGVLCCHLPSGARITLPEDCRLSGRIAGAWLPNERSTGAL